MSENRHLHERYVKEYNAILDAYAEFQRIANLPMSTGGRLFLLVGHSALPNGINDTSEDVLGMALMERYKHLHERFENLKAEIRGEGYDPDAPKRNWILV